MKKTHKQVLGLSSLALVAALTAYAATLPAPNAGAIDSQDVVETQDTIDSQDVDISDENDGYDEYDDYEEYDEDEYSGEDYSETKVDTTTVTDTLSVRVVGSVPDIEAEIDFNEDSILTNASPTLSLEYSNLNRIKISLSYKDGNGTNYVIEDFAEADAVDYEEYGVQEVTLDLSDYSFGTYTLTVTGYGFDDVVDTNSITFIYAPLTASIESEADGSATVTLDYTDHESMIGEIRLDVTKEGSDDILWTNSISTPETTANIPFYDFISESGTYIVTVSVYDTDGNFLYSTTLTYIYEVIPVPDTGAFTKELNIATEDYITTGVIIFFILAVVALSVLAKNKKSSKSRR